MGGIRRGRLYVAGFRLEGEVGLTARRLGIVEPVFANICVHKRMNRFTVRTKLKVDVQWTRTRFTLVHNIGKIHTFGTLI